MHAISVPLIYPLSACDKLHGLQWLREGVSVSLWANLQPAATEAWLAFLNSDPFFSDLIAVRPQLIGKIYRPYYRKNMPCLRRVAMLIDHYRFIQRLGWAPLILQAATIPYEVANLRGASGAPYRLQLRAIEPMERQGELVLSLLSGDCLIYASAFTFVQTEQGMQLGVGALQGPPGPTSLEMIRTATRDLYGLRPKDLLVQLMGTLAYTVGCAHMQSVSHRNRIARYGQLRQQRQANHDDFWRSYGAQLDQEGNFQLPCGPIAPPDRDERPFQQRSTARKRQATLFDLAAALGASLKRASR